MSRAKVKPLIVSRGAEIYVPAKQMREALQHIIDYFQDDTQVKYQLTIQVRSRAHQEEK